MVNALLTYVTGYGLPVTLNILLAAFVLWQGFKPEGGRR